LLVDRTPSIFSDVLAETLLGAEAEELLAPGGADQYAIPGGGLDSYADRRPAADGRPTPESPLRKH